MLPPSWGPNHLRAAGHVVLTVILFSAAVFLARSLSATFRVGQIEISPVWIPGAILYTALLVAPCHRWWTYYVGLCIGAWAAFHDDPAIPVPAALVCAQPLFASVALAAWVMRRYRTPLFEHPLSLLTHFGFAVLFAPVVTVLPLVLVRAREPGGDVWMMSLRSVLGIALGLAVVTPALTLTLSNARGWLRSVSWRQWLEIVALTAGLVLVGSLCFGGPAGPTANPALLYLPLPLLLWAATRFGLAAVSWALLAVALQSIWGAVRGRGPFTSLDAGTNVVHLQLFLLAVSLPMMLLAAATQELQRALSALREGQELNTQVLSSIRHGLFVLDRDLQYRLWNPAMERITGVPAAQVLGRSPQEVFPFSVDANVMGAMGRALAGETTQLPDLPYEIASTDRRGWASQEAGPLHDSRGKVVGVISTLTEVTAQRLERRSLQLLESAPDAMFVVNSDGVIENVNAQAERICGYSREEMVGQPVEMLLPEADRSRHVEHRTAYARNPVTRQMAGRDLVALTKSGIRVPIEVSLSPIHTEGGLLVVAAMRDVTDRKATEEALRRS